MTITEQIYAVSKKLPKAEQFGLVSQMRRASISLPENIAEGFRRRHNKEYRQFLHVSLASSAELETYVELINRLYALEELELLKRIDQFQRMLNTLIGRLKS